MKIKFNNDFRKFKKIFITGGAGFIGSHFAEILVEGKKDVVVFDNLSSGKKEFLKRCIGKSNFNFIQGDLLNTFDIKKALKEDVDIVFHFASNPDISKGYKDPTLDFRQTAIATFNLLMEMRSKKITSLVYFSGSGVYGDQGKRLINESFGPLTPVSMYGASKLSAEGLVCAFSSLYNIKSWIFRPANIIGDRLTHGVIFDFVNKLKKNPKELEVLGNGNQNKSYIFISDVINAVFLAIKKSNNDLNIFNISSDSYINVNDIANLVLSSMKLRNVKLIHTGGRVGWPGDVAIIKLSSVKLKKMGWKIEYSSKEAVAETLRYFLRNAYNDF